MKDLIIPFIDTNVGDRVYSIEFGWGAVIDKYLDEEEIQTSTIDVRFDYDNDVETYYLEGYRFPGTNRTLFKKEVSIIEGE